MEPGPSGSGRAPQGGGGGSGNPGMEGGGSAVQQTIMNPIPGPSHRPYLATPIPVPPHFLVAPEQLRPHQVRSGIDIGNLFKILNALQNRIALACGQHQYMQDPLNHPRPPEDGGYKPLTPQAAVRDIRSLCRQQRNLMEKLRRWNCINEGNCYDLIMKNIHTGICKACEPFSITRQKMKSVGRLLRKRKLKKLKKAMKKQAALAKGKGTQKLKSKVKMSSPAPPPQLPLSQSIQSPKKKRKKASISLVPPHPESFMSQENFLSELGLVTPEVYLKQQAESRRTERRRRTTANPKYKSNGSVDSSQIGQRTTRSRRGEPEIPEVKVANVFSSRTTGAARRRAQQKRYECTVCEKKDTTITCIRCSSGFHAECIRITASKAAPPSTVSVCPNCVDCNPNISASDCILLSRKMCRPSIMGIPVAASPRPRASAGSRVRKYAAAKRKATGRNSKASAQRRNPAPSAKSRKPSFKKPPPQLQTRKTPPRARKPVIVSEEGTLNHSSAVAAAAAVPAYCNTTRRSDDIAPKAEKRQGSRPCQTVTATLSTGVRDEPPLKVRGQERKRPLPTPSQSRPSSCETQPLVKPKKKVMVAKAVQLFPSSKCNNQMSKLKPLPIPSGMVFARKSAPPLLGPARVAPSDENKFDKRDENAENSVGDTSKTIVKAQDKTANSKCKKASGSKPEAIDPFCMRRTMMAMSMAAGIVLNGFKGSSTSATTTTSSSSSATITVESKQSSQSSEVPFAKAPSVKITHSEEKPITASVTTPKKKIANSAMVVTSSAIRIPQVLAIQPKPGISALSPREDTGSIKMQSSFPTASVSCTTGSSQHTSTGTPQKFLGLGASSPANVSNNLKPCKKAATYKPIPATPSSIVDITMRAKPKTPEIKKCSPVKKKKEMDPSTVKRIEETIASVIRKFSDEAPNNFDTQFSSARAEKDEFLNELNTSPKNSKSNVSTFGSCYNFSSHTALNNPTSTEKENNDISYTTSPLMPELTPIITSTNNVTRCSSPTSSASSTIGSSRSINDLDSDSEDLLSIPDTYSPSFEMKRLDQPRSLLNLDALNRLELLNRKTTTPTVSPVATKKGRVGGWKGRAGKF